MKLSYDSEVDAAYIRLEEGSFEVTTHELSEDRRYRNPFSLETSFQK